MFANVAIPVESTTNG